MCGRARITRPWREIHEAMSLIPTVPAQNLRENWNLCPTQDIIAVTSSDEGKRIGSLMHWGLIPSWSKEGKMTYPTFNARSDGYQVKASFKGAWKAGRRCLVVIDGYYEWRPSDKQPFSIAYVDRRPMAVAGLWETWRAKNGGETINSCTMLTIDASERMAPLHDRAPVFLHERDWPIWLGEKAADAAALVKTYPGDDIEWWPVGKGVGNRRSQGPQLAYPV
ncbi:MAG: SOS response-associated peptidase [Methanobacterium sp.]|nr:SOS response-associated peptidase [Methanobacterium sp.]